MAAKTQPVEKQNARPEAPKKRRYKPPVLAHIGSLAELTAGVGGSTFDMGQNNFTKMAS